MARKKAEIDLLGVATKEELIKFEVSKEGDKELSKVVADINANSKSKKLTTEEELLRIKKQGEQEILDIQNELKEFKVSEERKISFLPSEVEEEEEEVYEPTKFEKIKENISKPFVKIVEYFVNMSIAEKLDFLKSTFLVLLVLVTMILSYFAVKKNIINSSNFIHLKLQDVGGGQVANTDEELVFNGVPYRLGKILIDGQNTVFNFEDQVDFADKYSATVIDNYGKVYQVDQHYMRNVRDININKVLALDPLNDGVKEFELRILNNETSESFSYYFKLNKFLKKSGYVKLYNTQNTNKVGVNVDSITASATSTYLNYSLNSGGLPYTYKIIERAGMSTNLYKNMTILPSKQNKTNVYDFPDQEMVLIEETFISPEDFETTLNFQSTNIFKSYPIERDFSINEIKSNKTIDFGHYTINFSGIQKKGDTAVLVFNVIDNQFSQAKEETKDYTLKEKEEEIDNNFKVTSERIGQTENVYAILDAQLVLFNGKGEEVGLVSPTKINANDIGTDMVFIDDSLNYVVNNFKVRINSIDVRDEKYMAEIDLAKYKENTYDEYDMYLDDIKKGFNSRLAYKAAESPRSQITHFSEDILLDKELMANYIPKSLIHPATYSTNIIAKSFRGNKIFVAVEEDFLATSEAGFVHSNVDHRIIYDITERKIIYDEIVKYNK